MGQYHVLVSVERKEVLDPHDLGFLMKQGENEGGVAGLGDVLLALTTVSPMRGGGDWSDNNFNNEKRILGRWAGTRVIYFGDYTTREDLGFLTDEEAQEVFENAFACDQNGVFPNWKRIGEEAREWCSENFGVEYIIEKFPSIDSEGNPKESSLIMRKFRKDSFWGEHFEQFK